jgi:hypothetical protein
LFAQFQGLLQRMPSIGQTVDHAQLM